MDQGPRPEPTATALPTWRSVLAVVAHPDDESFGLGAILDAFAQAGSQTAVLCLTAGEASTVSAHQGELTAVRRQEFARAARRLGVSDTRMCDFPDGGLAQVCTSRLTGQILDAARDEHAEGLLVFDPSGVTGHPDHAAATRAALFAAAALDLPALGWTIPAAVAGQLNAEFGAQFTGHRPEAIDITLPVDRHRQLAAARAHASQAIPTSVLWRRLDLMGEQETLRWLHHPASGAPENQPADRPRNTETTA